MTTFEVREAVALEDRSLFALLGVISEGTPRIGMTATLEDAPDVFEEPVHGIEFLEREDDPEGTSPALTFSYSSPEKLERWRSIDWPGRPLTLHWRR